MDMESIKDQTSPRLGNLGHHVQGPNGGGDASGHDGVVGPKVVHLDINVIA